MRFALIGALASGLRSDPLSFHALLFFCTNIMCSIRFGPETFHPRKLHNCQLLRLCEPAFYAAIVTRCGGMLCAQPFSNKHLSATNWVPSRGLLRSQKKTP
jgi:hypothetical protein